MENGEWKAGNPILHSPFSILLVYFAIVNHFMRTPYFIIILLAGHLILACNGKTEVKVSDVMVEESKNAPEPPPPSFSCSNSLTLQEWFFKLCDTEKPGKDIIAYNLGLFDTDNCYAIYLIDSNEHAKEDKVSATKNDYEWPIEYYPLSKTEYKDLKWEQVLNKIKSQLKEYTNTEKFKNSSLAKAKAITIRFDDGDLVKMK